MMLLKNGTVVSGCEVKQLDVLIDGQKITKVEENIVTEHAEIIDVEGKLLFPGFIDGHTHFDLHVAGTTTADDFTTGSMAAIAGGTTMVIDFATQEHGETLKEALAHWHRKADKKSSCDYSFHMSISEWNESVAKELDYMIEEGITSFKLYMTYPSMMLNDGEIYEILKALNKRGCFAGVHCESASLIDALIREAKRGGRLSPSEHPKVRPAEMEAEAVHRLLVIADEAKAPVMVVHTTAEAAFKEIRLARERGQKVYSETCPHYLLLDDQVYEQPFFESSKYVCAPPIRKKRDQEVLWKALQQDEIDTIATDHCSFSTEQKAVGKDDFTKIPGGMPGVETRGVLLYTYGVCAGRITLEQMCRLLSENPAKLYGVFPQKGAIAPGSDADIVIIDPQKEGIITAKQQHYHMDYAPFEGMKISCCIDKVFLRGNQVVEAGEVINEKKGQFIVREKSSYKK